MKALECVVCLLELTARQELSERRAIFDSSPRVREPLIN